MARPNKQQQQQQQQQNDSLFRASVKVILFYFSWLYKLEPVTTEAYKNTPPQFENRNLAVRMRKVLTKRTEVFGRVHTG